MSIVKQKGVTSAAHAKNLCNYINSNKALLRDFQHILQPDDWFQEMGDIREANGHNTPSRGGAKNTTMFHQILAFLPDEADINGGVMTPEKCMSYAWEYLDSLYPSQQVALALHCERCDSDGIERYAVHLAINRTNLKTGNRLNAGKSGITKFDRVKTIRALDEKWGLRQVVKDSENSKLHKRQPRGAEKEISARGKNSYKAHLRELLTYASERAKNMGELTGFLNDWGVDTTIKKGYLYVTDRVNYKHTFRVPRLDGSLNPLGLQQAFERNTAADGGVATSSANNSEQYIMLAQARYQEYRKQAVKAKGTDFVAFPEIKLPRIPDTLKADASVREAVLSLLRKGDTLRRQMASNVPIAKQDGKTGTVKPQHQTQAQDNNRGMQPKNR